MATLDSPIDKLSAGWKALSSQWDGTTPLWHDSVSQRFEKNYLDLFENQTRFTLKEMQRLAQVIAEAQRRVR